MLAVSVEFLITFTVFLSNRAGGVTIAVPSSMISSPSSKSCISSNDILASRLLESKVPSSSSSVSWNVPSCSCVTRTTFSKVVSKTFVEELKPFTVPVWVVSVFAFAKVPVTSLRTKWALSVRSGGLVDLKSKPWSSSYELWSI